MIADVKNKNPFNILIGLLLKYYRVQKRVTSKDMAIMLNSGHSLYRLMESGASPLHPSKIYLLIEIFDDLFEDEQNIEFENLSKFLIGGQYIDALVNRKKRNSRSLTYQEALQEFLGNSGDDFNKLFNNVQGLFDLKTKEKDLNHLIDEKAPLELFDFLSLNNYEKNKTLQFGDKIIERIGNSYSLHIDMLLSMIKEFSTHPPMHISGIADKWEKNNHHNFEELRGFYLKEEIIINKNNFKLFDYDYLFDDNFKKLRMVFVSEKSSPELKDSFVQKLNASRNKKLTKREIDKINIKSIKSINENLKNLVADSDNSNPNNLMTFWVFSMSNGNQNGFIGFKNTIEKDYIKNLKYAESIRRLEIFDKEWDNIN